MPMPINPSKIIPPQEGMPDDVYERLEAYIEQFDPDWVKNIKPASEVDIQRLQAYKVASGEPLVIPKIYMEFLRKMGADDGGLLEEAFDGSTGLSEILEYLEEDKLCDACEPIRKGILPFYVRWTSMRYAILLESKDCMVVESEGEEAFDWEYESFEKMLFHAAIKRYSYFECRWHIVGGIKEVALAEKQYGPWRDNVGRLLENYGLELSWLSGEKRMIAFREDVIFMLNISKTGGVHGQLLGNNKFIIEKMLKALEWMIGTEKIIIPQEDRICK